MKDRGKCTMFGLYLIGYFFLYENRNLLGWYVEDLITKEIDTILVALVKVDPTSKLRYCTLMNTSNEESNAKNQN